MKKYTKLPVFLLGMILLLSQDVMGLTIVTPTEGQIVYQGDKFTVAVKPEAGENWDEVLITRTPQLEYFLYICDLSTTTITPKMRTTLIGNDYLIPVTNKIALHERQYVGKFKSMRLETDYQSSGKIHIFDAAAGKEVGMVKINVEQNGKFVGVSPSEDKLYFLSYGADFSSPMLHIIDLKTYFVVKTLPMPEASMSMVFFEE